MGSDLARDASRIVTHAKRGLSCQNLVITLERENNERKKAVMVVVLALALTALAIPLVGLNGRAAGSAGNSKPALTAANTNAAMAASATSPKLQEIQPEAALGSGQVEGVGKISAETMNALGLRRLPKGVTPQDASN